jgi:hypothetical protein
MLQDSFLLWPYGKSGVSAAMDDGLHKRFETSGLSEFLNTPAGDLAEFLAFECSRWNINPWFLVSFGQREQSIFRRTPRDISNWAKMAWLGFVGQDVGHVKAPGWYGAFMQVSRAVEQTAWLAGVEDSRHWPQYVRDGKKTARWPSADAMAPMDFKDLDERPTKRAPKTMMEYVLLTYTPHEKTLITTESAARALSPEHFFA